MKRGSKGLGATRFFFWLAMAAAAAAGQEDRLAVGLRTGVSATSYDDKFYQTDIFCSWDLPHHGPWYFESSSGWYLQSRLTGSAGWLIGQHEGAFVGTMGLSFLAGQHDFPLYLDFGSSPTLLSRDEFGTTDFGIPFQFTTYGGLYFRLNQRVSIGYRLQHMSNASLKSNVDNPGLDLHVVGMSYHF